MPESTSPAANNEPALPGRAPRNATSTSARAPSREYVPREEHDHGRRGHEHAGRHQGPHGKATDAAHAVTRGAAANRAEYQSQPANPPPRSNRANVGERRHCGRREARDQQAAQHQPGDEPHAKAERAQRWAQQATQMPLTPDHLTSASVRGRRAQPIKLRLKGLEAWNYDIPIG